MNNEKRQLRIGKCEDTLSAEKFYAIFGGTLLYGFLLNAIFAVFFTDIFAQMNPIALIVGYLVLAISGVFMSKFGGALLSFIGFSLVVIPSGALISVCLLDYNMGTITTALFIVALIALVMFFVAIRFPEKMLSLGFPLFISLCVGIGAELICFLLGLSTGIFDWIFVLIFAGYLGYDFSVVSNYDKTFDNAIDSALDVYLDIVNLFLRILSILGGKSSSKK